MGFLRPDGAEACVYVRFPALARGANVFRPLCGLACMLVQAVATSFAYFADSCLRWRTAIAMSFAALRGLAFTVA